MQTPSTEISNINMQAINDLIQSIGADLVYNQLLPLFCNELQDYISHIGTDIIEIAQEDPVTIIKHAKRLAEIAHMLKSSAASFGAEALVSLAKQIDNQYKAEQLNELTLLIKQQQKLQQIMINNLAIYSQLSPTIISN